MPKIALIEPYDHSEVLYVLCELLLGQQEVKLCIFTQQYIQDHAPDSISKVGDISWFTFEQEGRVAFFNQHLAQLNSCDLIIWITAVPPYRWMLELNLRPPILLIIHNRNHWFAPLRNLSVAVDSPKSLLKDKLRLLRWLLFQQRHQRLLLGKVAAVGYGSRRILAEAIKKGHLPASGKAFWVPFTYLKHRPVNERPATEAITIVIPGVVTDNGRDYYSVARALAMAMPKIQRPIHLVLLGKVGPVKGLRDLQQLVNERFQLTIFPHWIAQKEYEACLREADFLILPFRPGHKVGFVQEDWGRSGFSGAVSDMVYYGLPALCSAFHPLDAAPENWVERYADCEALANLLEAWANERKFLEVRKIIQSYEGELQRARAGRYLMEELLLLIKRQG